MNKERSRKNKKWDSEGDLTWKMPSQLGDRWFLKTILLGLLHMLFHIKIKEYCPPTRTFGWILSCKIMNYEAISLELCIHAQDTLTRKACTLVWTSFSSISMLSFLFGGWSIKSNVPILGSATSPLVDLSSFFFFLYFSGSDLCYKWTSHTTRVEMIRKLLSWGTYSFNKQAWFFSQTCIYFDWNKMVLQNIPLQEGASMSIDLELI